MNASFAEHLRTTGTLKHARDKLYDMNDSSAKIAVRHIDLVLESLETKRKAKADKENAQLKELADMGAAVKAAEWGWRELRKHNPNQDRENGDSKVTRFDQLPLRLKLHYARFAAGVLDSISTVKWDSAGKIDVGVKTPPSGDWLTDAVRATRPPTFRAGVYVGRDPF